MTKIKETLIRIITSKFIKINGNKILNNRMSLILTTLKWNQIKICKTRINNGIIICKTRINNRITICKTRINNGIKICKSRINNGIKICKTLKYKISMFRILTKCLNQDNRINSNKNKDLVHYFILVQ